MIDFAGWEMPLSYHSVIDEHLHTRRACGVFDISHMGRLIVRGTDALSLLEEVCTRRLGTAAVGQSRYAHICNPQGGVLDDVIVSRFEDHWLVVCNAVNREKILAWLYDHLGRRGAAIDDRTHATAMVAVQGPVAIELASGLLDGEPGALGRYRFARMAFEGDPCTVFRSGYTGEDGVEVILGAERAEALWGRLCDRRAADGGRAEPVGLAARDTLRLEAGMPLYGHELGEQIDSLTAGLAWCVDLGKDFIGRDALKAIAGTGPARRLVGLHIEGRRIPRQGMAVTLAGRPVGEVASGTMSPTLGRPIATAFIDAEHARSGICLQVDLRGRSSEAQVTSLPFYRRPK